MLSAKENFLETIKVDGKPDRLVMDYEFCRPVLSDPVMRFTRGNRKKGFTTKDQWGTTYRWPEEQLFAFPTEEDLVCPDITEWRDTVKVPDLKANCSEDSLWKDCREDAEKVREQGYMALAMMGTGIFEQAHNLMGISDTCVNFLMEPEEMAALLGVIGQYRLDYTKLLVDKMHPDCIVSHDDWGTKATMFMSPDTWAEFLKPLYEPMYKYMKDNGVVILHHADSFCEPIVDGMIDIGIDVWQGCLNTNDIVKLQKQTAGKITLMGGIDSVVDRVDSTEDEIRADVRKVCETYGPGGHFIPSITYGLPGTLFAHVQPVINDEINKYNKETYGVAY